MNSIISGTSAEPSTNPLQNFSVVKNTADKQLSFLTFLRVAQSWLAVQTKGQVHVFLVHWSKSMIGQRH